MKNKSLLLFSLLIISSLSGIAQQKISILGDSYSTFYGYITPDKNSCWYGVPGANRDNDVKRVEDTWWHRLIHEHNYKLEVNNSFSGATICNTGHNKKDYTDRSFITRMTNLGKPDVILIFGGTNDSWVKAPIGAYKYTDWTKEELYSFRPAFCFLLDSLLKEYPEAKIYNISNSELSAEVTDSMEKICQHYNIPNIQLHDIEKQSGHPSIAGMKSICEQVCEVVGVPTK